MPKHILALDIGTQSSRAALVAAGGDILRIEQIRHEVDSPHPGWAQQQPDAWWNETCQAVRNVLHATGTDPASIAAVSACGQMHGPVGVDERGKTTTPWVQLWCDKRCEEQCAEVRRAHDEGQLSARAANPINPAWVGLKVRWYKEHEPAAYERARWFLVPKDFINFRLTGVAATDPSEASGSFLWDHQRDAYSDELAAAVGVDAGRFAPAHRSHDVVGQVTDEAARATGLAPGTPVVAGGGDFPVSLLGFGVVGRRIAADVTGSSTLFAVHAEKPLIHPAVQNLRHVVDGWIPFTILDCGGLSMKWCQDWLASAREEDVPFEKLIAMAADVPPGSDGLLFYPYMLGERRRENTAARGGFFGLTLNHRAPHFVRAVMEGVALAMARDAALFASLGVEVDQLLCVGGGARNALWNRIKADATQRPLTLADEPEAGVKGAALLGEAGAGLIADPAAEAVARRTAGTLVPPGPDTADWSRRALAQFSRVYEHMLGFRQA